MLAEVSPAVDSVELMPPDCSWSECRPLRELTPQTTSRGCAEVPVTTAGSTLLASGCSVSAGLPMEGASALVSSPVVALDDLIRRA